MQFTFCLIPNMTVQQAGDAVLRAQEWGCDRVWILDEAFMRDPYVLLGSIASRTDRIGLGVGIANPYTRHPMQLTRAVCTAADLRQERVDDHRTVRVARSVGHGDQVGGHAAGTR